MYEENKPQYRILLLIALAHGLNDLIQGMIPSIYPTLQAKYALTMTQIGIITLCYQLSASILQPLVGNYTDKHPQPYSQVLGMAFTTLGAIFLSMASSYTTILLSVVLIGVGSSVFHPESSRVAFLASGGKTLFCPSYFSIRRQFRYSFRPPIGYIIGFQQESSRWTVNRRSSSRAINMVLLIFYFCNAYPYIDRQMAQYIAKTTEEKG